MSAQPDAMQDRIRKIRHWIGEQIPKWHSRSSLKKDWQVILVVALLVALLVQLPSQSLFGILAKILDLGTGGLDTASLEEISVIWGVIIQTAPLCLSLGLIFLLYIWDILKGKKNDIIWIGLIMYIGLRLCNEIGAWSTVPQYERLVPPGVPGGPFAAIFVILEFIYNPLATYYRGFGMWGFGSATVVGLFLAWAVGKKLAPGVKQVKRVEPQPAVQAIVEPQQSPYGRVAFPDGASGKTTTLAGCLMIATTAVSTAWAAIVSLSLPRPGIDTWSGVLPLVLVVCAGGLIAAATTLVGRVALNRNAEIPAFLSFAAALVYAVVTGQVQQVWDRSLMLLTGQLWNRAEFSALFTSLFSTLLCILGTFTIVYAMASNTRFCEACEQFMKSLPSIWVLPAETRRRIRLVRSHSFGTLLTYLDQAAPKAGGSKAPSSQLTSEVEIYYCESCHSGYIGVYIPELVGGNTINRRVVSEPLQRLDVEAILRAKAVPVSSGGVKWKRLLLLAPLFLVLLLQGCGEPPQWPEFTSKEGRFTVLMPGKPFEKTITTQGLEGHRFAGTSGDETYAVVYYDLPAASVDAADIDPFLDNILRAQIAATDYKLLSLERITLQSYPGRELKGKPPFGVGLSTVRIYLVEDRIYSVEYLTTKDETPSDNRDKFFNSFKLISQ